MWVSVWVSRSKVLGTGGPAHTHAPHALHRRIGKWGSVGTALARSALCIEDMQMCVASVIMLSSD